MVTALAAVVVTAVATACAGEVGIRSDVAYGPEPGQVLDIYLPDDDDADRAVVVLVHGGGWEQGGKGDLARNARELAEEGIVAVSVAMLVTVVVLAAADRVHRMIGERGVLAMERLMGLVLTALAVEMLLSGIRMFTSGL